jgi:16S rRNA (cytidine1402-2'-O)-methyltransferase
MPALPAPPWLKQALKAMTDRSGTLYVVATPIGNLEDITLRALRVLREADVIAAEDTRHTMKLLERHAISGGGRLTSYFDHNERFKTPQLIAALEAGQSVALVSDAGTPAISDPGYDLVRAAAERGLKVVAVPGPSAAAAAVSIAGLPSDRFLFVGFLPSRSGQRRRVLAELARERATLVFYVPGRNLSKVLGEMRQVLGERRSAACRELTKLNEEVLRGGFGEVLSALAERPERLRGEAVVVVAGAPEEPRAGAPEAERMLSVALAEGTPLREAVREVAAATGIARRQVYQMALNLKAGRAMGRQELD